MTGCPPGKRRWLSAPIFSHFSHNPEIVLWGTTKYDDRKESEDQEGIAMTRCRACFAVLLFLVLILVGCSASAERDGEQPFMLSEPEYAGLEVNGKPKFNLAWDSYPGASSYEIAFYAEGEDSFGRGPFAIRSTKGVYGGGNHATVIFLQGVYTDTVTYRVKVRPQLQSAGSEKKIEPTWSNIWEIRFTEGEYTVLPTDQDFDRNTVRTEPAGTATGKKEPDRQLKTPLEHNYPEPLLVYLAKEAGMEIPVSTELISEFSVAVNHCEYGEPPQTIRNADMVRAFGNAVEKIMVTGKEDSVSSTETYIAFSAKDQSANSLFAFSVQNGLLERSDGRYGLSGLSDLMELDGVLYESGWNAYWEEQERMEREYGSEHIVSGAFLTEAAGYRFHRLAGNAPDSILSVSGYIDWDAEPGRLETSDRAEITSLWNALSRMKIGNRVSSPKGQMWHMIFTYLSDTGTFCDSVYLAFHGSTVKIGSIYYTVEGIEQLFGAVDNSMLEYLRDYPDAPKIQPSY